MKYWRNHAIRWNAIAFGGVLAGSSVFGHRWPWLAIICIVIAGAALVATIIRERRRAE